MLPNRNEGQGNIGRHGAKGKPHKSKPHKSKAPKRPSRLDDPNYVTAPRTLRDINREAGASANLRYGGVEAANALTERRTDPWFEQYKGQVTGIAQGIQQGYDKANAEIAARTAATQTANDTSRGQMQSSMQADAASRGATVDPNVFRDDANAANVRRQNADAQANQLTAQGQSAGTYFGGVQAAAGSQQIVQHQSNAAEARKIQADKGLYRSGEVTKGVDAERTYGLQRAAFEVPTANSALSAQTSTANSRRTARSQRAARRVAKTQKDQDQALARSRLKTQQEKIAYDRAHPKAGAKGTAGLTPVQKAARSEKWGKATSRATDAGNRWRLYKSKTVNGGKPSSPSMIKERLIKEGFSTEEIHIGWLIAHDKPFGAKDRAMARRLKIRVPKQPKLPKKAIDQGAAVIHGGI